MKNYLKYFLVVAFFLLSAQQIFLVMGEETSTPNTDAWVSGFTPATILPTNFNDLTPSTQAAVSAALAESAAETAASTWCTLTLEEILITDSSTGAIVGETQDVDGRAYIYARPKIEDILAAKNKELEKYNGAVVGTPAGDKFAALKAERDILLGWTQSYYDNYDFKSGPKPSNSRKGVAYPERITEIMSKTGLSISSYNSVSGTPNASLGFTSTDSGGKQTFVTPTDVFVSDGQSFSDSKEELINKCLASCKIKGGTTSDCNRMCKTSRCGCRDDDSDGRLEAMCEAGQFGPECLGIGSCNINMCDDPDILKSLGSGTALSTLVAKYYKTSTGSSNTNQNQGAGSGSDIQVSGFKTSKKCNADGSCDITITSSVDDQIQPAYLKWDNSGQGATLLTGNAVLQIQGNLAAIQMKAGEPIKIHLDASVANELLLGSGAQNSDRIECLSCSGSTVLANRNSTGCDKDGETNPHAECIGTYDCNGAVRYGCWNFNFCGINQCNDYALDANGQKPQSMDCQASTSNQKWKCASRQNCVASSDGIYNTKSECLSSIGCGGGGTVTERNTYYCCNKSAGSCSLCDNTSDQNGSPQYVNSTQCANDCSKTVCPNGQTKCGSTCCRDIDQTCENYTTCRGTVTCSANGGMCCPNGCAGSTATGLCGGTGVSCCATGCK